MDERAHRVTWRPDTDADETVLEIPAERCPAELCNAIRSKLHPGTPIDEAFHASVDAAIKRPHSRPGGSPGNPVGGNLDGEKAKRKGR